MIELDDLLKSIGLENYEADVYLASISLWTVASSVIAKKISIPRSSAQFTCDQLVKKQVMTKAKKGNMYLYTADPPDKLYTLIQIQSIELQKKRNELEMSMDKLRKMYNPYTSVPKITYYEWADGIKKMMSKLMDDKEYAYVFSAWDYLSEEIWNVVDIYQEKASIPDDFKLFRSKKYKDKHDTDDERFQTKYFKGIEELTTDIRITKDTVSFISWDSDYPVWVLIQNNDISESFKNIFLELWKR